jgi:hypothetical protein
MYARHGMRSNEQQLHSGTLARAPDTVKGVTESAEVSVEVLLIWQPTGVDISGRSRASSLPIGYSSLPSDAERLPQASRVSAKAYAKAFCRSA